MFCFSALFYPSILTNKMTSEVIRIKIKLKTFHFRPKSRSKDLISIPAWEVPYIKWNPRSSFNLNLLGNTFLILKTYKLVGNRLNPSNLGFLKEFYNLIVFGEKSLNNLQCWVFTELGVCLVSSNSDPRWKIFFDR